MPADSMGRNVDKSFSALPVPLISCRSSSPLASSVSLAVLTAPFSVMGGEVPSVA